MPESKQVQFREEKVIKRAFEYLEPKDKFLNWIWERLKNIIDLIVNLDKTIKK